MYDRASNAPRTSFWTGLIDGMLARHVWDATVRRAPKAPAYILGEIWAMGVQPLALLFAVLDFFDHRLGSVAAAI